jgi:hypothetical protein
MHQFRRNGAPESKHCRYLQAKAVAVQRMWRNMVWLFLKGIRVAFRRQSTQFFFRHEFARHVVHHTCHLLHGRMAFGNEPPEALDVGD